MKKIIFLSFLSLISFSSISQTAKLKKANSLYEHLDYAQAATLYLDLIGSEVDSRDVKSKIANCFYQMGDSEKAEEYYALLVQSSPNPYSNDLYQYAQALKENGKYSESDKWMDKFLIKDKNDSRGVEFANNRNYAAKIHTQGAYFKIRHLSLINSAQGDFGGYPWGRNKVLFISNRKNAGIIRYHAYNDEKFMDIYVAQKTPQMDLTNPKYKSKKVNKRYHEGPLCFMPDGKRVFFTRNNMQAGKDENGKKKIQKLKMFWANVDLKGNWSEIKEFEELNSEDYSVGHPSVSVDGKYLYFSSDMPGGEGGADIYRMEIKEDGTFGSKENLGKEINTEGQEMFPWISSEGVLFISSDGHLGLGGLDVFAALPNKANGFSRLMNLGKPINGKKDDFAFIMHADNKNGYFSSNRVGGNGDDDIYAFELIKPLENNIVLKGIIAEMGSNRILPDAIIELLDAKGNVVATTKSNTLGAYEFELEPEMDYTIVIQKDMYTDIKQKLTTNGLNSKTQQIDKNIFVEKKANLSLLALVTDAKTNQPVEGVTVKITDLKTGQEIVSLLTSANGQLTKALMGNKMSDVLKYKIQLSKDGYFPKAVNFNHTVNKPGVIKIHEILKGSLSMDPAVDDLKDLIQINDIRFDLNKYNIRPDAAKELDKIVEVMNKYPAMEVELGAHTDCRGSKGYNEKLSDRRAKSSAAYIKSKITNPERISGKGYGESRLLNGCACEGSVKSDCSEEEHEKNRRTEFKVISAGAAIMRNR